MIHMEQVDHDPRARQLIHMIQLIQLPTQRGEGTTIDVNATVGGPSLAVILRSFAQPAPYFEPCPLLRKADVDRAGRKVGF